MLYKLSERIEKKLIRYCVTILKINKRFCFNSDRERQNFIVKYENIENLAVQTYAEEKGASMSTEDWTIEQDGTALDFKYKGDEMNRITI